MNRGKTLRIVENAADIAQTDNGIFVIESALQEVHASELEDIFRQVSEAELGQIASLPLYGVIRIHLAFLFAQNQSPPMAIPHLVVLFRLLDEHLDEHEYDNLRCEGVSENYQAVVTDVALKHDVSVEGTEQFGFRHTVWGFLVGIYGYFRLVVDQLLSLVLKRSHRQHQPVRTAFVPHVNRFDSTRPVLDRLEHNHEVILPIPTVAWLRRRNGKYGAIRKYDPTPVDYFATPSRILESIRRGIRLLWQVLARRSFNADVRRFILDEFGVNIPNTVNYVLGNLFAVHVSSLANAVVAEGMLEDLDPDQVVIGSLGSRQQAILYAAIKAGIDTYHIPHSATTGYELAPPPETVHFTPGEHVVDHLQASGQISTTENIVPTGRPQLARLSRQEISPAKEWTSDATKIVVATQPFPDAIRREFIIHILDAIEMTPEPVDVVIKIHPNESAIFYEQVTADCPYPVQVVEENLHGYITAADVVVTINSNVGLESMVLETPCVCVNEWDPLIRARPYAIHGPTPVLQTADEVTEFFADLSETRIKELADGQHGFVTSTYLDGNPAECIAHILEESR